MPTSGLRSRISQRSAPSSSGHRWADDSYDFTVRAERSSPLHRHHDPVRHDDRRLPALTTAAPLAVASASASYDGASLRVPALARRACEHVRKLPPRRDVELAERPSQVGLDRFLGDEERLGDLAVCAARGGELDHAPLARGQRVRPGALGASGPDADRCELGSRPALEGSGAAAGGPPGPPPPGGPGGPAL